jgi:hypothetical protein
MAQSNPKQTSTWVSIALASLALVACGGGSSGNGGGGGGGGGPVNSAPTVSAPVISSASDNDAAYTISQAELLANASDTDGDMLSVSGLTVASGNAAGITANSDTVDVDPAAYDALADSASEVIELSYTVSDGNGGTASATLEITIAGANDAPRRAALSHVSVADGQPTTGGYRVGTLYYDDPEGDDASFAVVGGADADVFSVSGISLVIDDGTLAATSQDRYEVTVQVTDSGGATLDFDVTLLVHESPPLTVGYYDLVQNMGRAEQATPITFIGETAVDVGDLTAADLSGMDMLFFQNPVGGAPPAPFTDQANLDKVAAFVTGGGVLIMHDRHVTTMADFLPGEPGALVQDAGATRTEFELVEAPTFVSDGPGGTIDDTNLESPNSLSFGFAQAPSLPWGSMGFLSRNDADHWISYAYPAGQGYVIYSPIPLDFYLLAGNPDIMRDVYAPNILAQGRALVRKGVDLDADGLLDSEETLLGTLLDAADSDADGMSDLYEVRNGLDPNDAGDADGDPDADGLTNLEEQDAATFARNPDSDSDGLSDGDEVGTHGTNPLSNDTDDDLLSDFDEVNVDGTDPTLFDTDAGGTGDGREVLVDFTDPLDPDDDLNQIDLPMTLNDVNGYIWDIFGDGNINNGTSDAYDGGMRLSVDAVAFPTFATGSLSEDGREIVLAFQDVSGLRVSRRVRVPDDQAFVRYLDVLRNPTGDDITVSVQISTNLGSDGNTVIVSTSDGDAAIEATDTWVVTDDTSNGGGDPSLAHVFAGPGGAVAPVVTAPLGNILYTYELTVPANGRAIVMHFDSQNANRAAASASAAYLVGLGNGTLNNMTPDDLADVVNFDLMQPAAVSRPALKVLAPLCEAGEACR